MRRSTGHGNAYLESLGHPVTATSPSGAASMGIPPLDPAASAALGPSSSILGISPWWLYKYENAQDWYQSNLNFNLAAGAVASLVTAFSQQVPINSKLILKQFVIQITNPTNLTNVFVTLLRNNNPINGWSNILFLPMNAATEALPYNDVDLRFDEGEIFTATFTNGNAGTAWVVGILASGWFVQKSDIARLQGGVRY